MAHRGGDCFAEENSIAAIKQSLKLSPDIIEIDLRKSTDNVIYCYHGNNFQYIFTSFFFKKKLAKLKQNYPSIATLKEINAIIPQNTILLLDIKDTTITKQEIIQLMQDTKAMQILIASRSLNYLQKLGTIPKNYKKVCNGGIFFLGLNKKQFCKSDINIIELFHWDFNQKNITLLKKNNKQAALAAWFLSRKKYKSRCFKHNSFWIWDYDLPKLKKYLIQRLN